MKKVLTMLMIALMSGMMTISCDTNDKLETMDQELAEMREKYDQLKEEQEKLQSEQDQLQEEYDQLKQKHDNLQDEVDRINADPSIVGEVFENSIVDQPVSYPGGQAAMLKYIAENLVYPEAAIKDGLQGTVVVKLLITKEGIVKNCKIQKSLSPECDKEAIRVCMSLETFIPAVHQGKPVSVYYTLPIKYKL